MGSLLRAHIWNRRTEPAPTRMGVSRFSLLEGLRPPIFGVAAPPRQDQMRALGATITIQVPWSALCVLHSVSGTFTRRHELEHRQRTSPSTVLGAMAGRRIRVRACLHRHLGRGEPKKGFIARRLGEIARRRGRGGRGQPKHREWMSRVEIAEEHAMAVEILDGLLHPYEEFNGNMAYPLFTEDYYRDAEGCKRQWRRQRDWHARMAEKYVRAALSPWDPVPPDPPLP